MPFLEPPLRVASAHLSLLGLEQPTRLFPGRQALRLPLWTFGKHGLAEHWRGSLIARTDSRPEPGSAPPEALRLVPTTGDGRCLFRAIAKCLAFYGKRPLPEHLERADADALREAAFQEICLLRRQEFQKKHVVEGDMGAYCAQLRSPEFYAGEPEMFALADVLERPIEVYLVHPQNRTLLKIVEYGSVYRKRQQDLEPVRVAYNGTNHYSALLPRTQR
ncbi:hypothetical protein, conserved [Cyanidioschyzon merolae strain 10D]|jgi:hypothetical protein|uniref:Ubiquitin thioesterase OTU n=1 Tax=Cyanidioschyzon merolae (strain NIES-3377 / 10D) TaxID=280699 RepID=M1VHG0_CYAM1|nr:hypothetical protein, conserved [Cyanidioschyzon merolae strain 10D]BAM80298.1 hypothetical protein, conserved [Cyanidioschyzon merolae strain 10D]|eukprot:XP_005534905.1 hypothetical protein, conserved [Cyanidioschyzon merolae strain 10D]